MLWLGQPLGCIFAEFDSGTNVELWGGGALIAINFSSPPGAVIAVRSMV